MVQPAGIAYRQPGTSLPRDHNVSDDASVMAHRSLCIDVELSEPAAPILVKTGHEEVQALIRLHGEPLGTVRLPVVGGICRAVDVRKEALKSLGWEVIRHLMEDRLAAGMPPDGWSVKDLPHVAHPALDGIGVTVTVAVCTRDRPDDLAICLQSLRRLQPRPLEVIVVENAPKTVATERLVKERFPWVRYVQEPRPGLDWARNRAIIEARGDVIAFTDDDCVADSRWVGTIAAAFAADPVVMAVTGLVEPFELETEAQHVFERHGGFGRGYKRLWYSVDRDRGLPWEYCGAGRFGTGANMAYRRTAFEAIGLFDPALDVGTVTNGGGDLDMFFRVLAEGHVLVYEPAALIRHRHRRKAAELRRQVAGNGYGFISFLVANLLAYPQELARFVYLWMWWFWRWEVARVARGLVVPTRVPVELTALELRSGLFGVLRYFWARRAARRIEKRFGPQEIGHRPIRRRWMNRWRGNVWVSPIALRTVELSSPVAAIQDVEAYEVTKLLVTSHGRLIGTLVVPNHHRSISARQLRDAIGHKLGIQLLSFTREGGVGAAWNFAEASILDAFGAPEPPVLQERLPATVPVSVIVATLDRPDGLRHCLADLRRQVTSRQVEVVVVDNNPRSGKTPPVVAEFPGVRLISEKRRGLAYARNAGFLAATGDVLVCTDDDVSIPEGWLEHIVAPFVRADVMVVTGDVIPMELENEAQIHFETYGGLGRGEDRFEVGGDWFESFRFKAVPTWELGATANAAFRASVLSDPAVGLMDEALGPGTPTGVGEDAYLIYRILKAHYRLVYEPAAYVQHHHRATNKALRRQIFGYSKGHVAYQLTTLSRDRDLRALSRVFWDLPLWRLQQLVLRLRHRTTYPTRLVLLETWGNLLGAPALVLARLRVRALGRTRRPLATATVAGERNKVEQQAAAT